MTAGDVAAVRLSAIALVEKERGDTALARETMGTALKRLDEVDGDQDPRTWVEAWAVVAPALYTVGRRDDARRDLPKAIERTGKIEKLPARGSALVKVARVQHTLAKTTDGAATLAEAEAVAVGLTISRDRLSLLSEVCVGWQTIAKANDADRTLKTILDEALAATSLEEKAGLSAIGAATQAGLERRDAALATFQQARQAAEEVPDRVKRVFAMFEVGERMWRSGFKKQGRELLEACRSAALAIPDKQSEFKGLYPAIDQILNPR